MARLRVVLLWVLLGALPGLAQGYSQVEEELMYQASVERNPLVLVHFYIQAAQSDTGLTHRYNPWASEFGPLTAERLAAAMPEFSDEVKPTTPLLLEKLAKGAVALSHALPKEAPAMEPRRAFSYFYRAAEIAEQNTDMSAERLARMKQEAQAGMVMASLCRGELNSHSAARQLQRLQDSAMGQAALRWDFGPQGPVAFPCQRNHLSELFPRAVGEDILRTGIPIPQRP